MIDVKRGWRDRRQVPVRSGKAIMGNKRVRILFGFYGVYIFDQW
jgi:hypothetical protein